MKYLNYAIVVTVLGLPAFAETSSQPMPRPQAMASDKIVADVYVDVARALGEKGPITVFIDGIGLVTYY